ncbi:MAG: GspH/FimT family pseudopilin [Candidatus Competibacteraceae bacterium]
MRSAKGFTLIEMMITVAIAAILLTVAVPGFQAFIANNRLSTQANTFISSLQLARSEAIKRNLSVTVCQSGDGQSCNTTNGFEQGWIVFVDPDNSNTRDTGEAIILANQGLPQGMSLTGGRTAISYRADGTVAPLNNTTLHLCHQGNTNGRDIVINVTGRIRVATVTNCS